MAHRDDHEAARARIAALERELAETKERARRAEESPPERAPTITPAERRLRRALRVLVAAVHAPAWLAMLVLSGETGAKALLAVALAGVGAQLALTYVAGRVCRVRFPSTAAMVSLLSAPLLLAAIALVASDLAWSELLGPARVEASAALRWLVRAPLGALVLVAGAWAAAAWSAEASRTEGPAD